MGVGRSWIELYLLLLIAEKPAHGYELSSRINDFEIADAESAERFSRFFALVAENDWCRTRAVVVSAVDETRILDENFEAAVSGVARDGQARASGVLDSAIDDFDFSGN